MINHFRKNRQFIKYWLPVYVLLLFVNCTLKVKLVGEYDEIVDNSIHQVESKTTAFLKKVIDNNGIGEGSYQESSEFYSEMRGEVQSLIVRSEVIETGLKRMPLTENFKELARQYDDLEILHKTAFNKDVFEKAQEAFEQSFRAIVKHLIYLKWNQEPPEGK